MSLSVVRTPRHAVKLWQTSVLATTSQRKVTGNERALRCFYRTLGPFVAKIVCKIIYSHQLNLCYVLQGTNPVCIHKLLDPDAACYCNLAPHPTQPYVEIVTAVAAKRCECILLRIRCSLCELIACRVLQVWRSRSASLNATLLLPNAWALVKQHMCLTGEQPGP